MDRRGLATLALGLAAAVSWSLAAQRVVSRDVPEGVRRVATRLGAGLGVTIDIGDVVPLPLGRVALLNVSVGHVRAARIQVGPSFGAWLYGSLAAIELQIDRVDAGDWKIARAHAHVERVGGRTSIRATAVGLRAEVAGLPVEIRRLGLDATTGRRARAAFAGASVAGLDELSGAIARRPDGTWRVRAARQGLQLDGKVSGADRAMEGRIRFDHLELAGVLRDEVASLIDLDTASLSGELAYRGNPRQLRLDVDAALHDLTVHHTTLSSAPLEHLRPTLTGAVLLERGRIATEGFLVAMGQVALRISAERAPPAFAVDVDLERTECTSLLAAIPDVLRRNLAGIELRGALAGRLHLAGTTDDLDSLELTPHLAVGCEVVHDAPRAPMPELVRGPATLATRGADGVADQRLLAVGAPTYARLEDIPERVIRAFVSAEDARFFRHHGFNPERIRKALAVDLSEGRAARGASTISQQVVKNLFLSGERTLGRKLEEAVLTWRMEQVLSKQRILELYLNLAELGPGIYGIRQAAAHYFRKRHGQLTSDEAVRLAALLPAPRRGMDEAWARRYEALKARLHRDRAALTQLIRPF